jgi:hypothetical protein
VGLKLRLRLKRVDFQEICLVFFFRICNEKLEEVQCGGGWRDMRIESQNLMFKPNS